MFCFVFPFSLPGRPPFAKASTECSEYSKFVDGTFEFPNTLAPCVVDLLRSLWSSDPAHRPDCAAVLQHEWVASPNKKQQLQLLQQKQTQERGRNEQRQATTTSPSSSSPVPTTADLATGSHDGDASMGSGEMGSSSSPPSSDGLTVNSSLATLATDGSGSIGNFVDDKEEFTIGKRDTANDEGVELPAPCAKRQRLGLDLSSGDQGGGGSSPLGKVDGNQQVQVTTSEAGVPASESSGRMSKSSSLTSRSTVSAPVLEHHHPLRLGWDGFHTEASSLLDRLGCALSKAGMNFDVDRVNACVTTRPAMVTSKSSGSGGGGSKIMNDRVSCKIQIFQSGVGEDGQQLHRVDVARVAGDTFDYHAVYRTIRSEFFVKAGDLSPDPEHIY